MTQAARDAAYRVTVLLGLLAKADNDQDKRNLGRRIATLQTFINSETGKENSEPNRKQFWHVKADGFPVRKGPKKTRHHVVRNAHRWPYGPNKTW